MSDATGRDTRREDEMKVTIDLLNVQGQPIDVMDAGTQQSYLRVNDEVEWVSGQLDVTLTFDSRSMFGQPHLHIPSHKDKDKLKVVGAPPMIEQRSYTIVDTVTPHAFRRLGEPRSHPVMIIGP
jgi:hypothetical protein